MQLYKKVLILGTVLVVVFNPLSVNIWSDFLVTALDYIADQLITISDYTVIVGATLLLLGFVMAYDSRNKKQTAKLKNLKNKNTKQAGDYII